MAPSFGTCGCGSTWPAGDRYGHCTVCHRTFSGSGAYDRHLLADPYPERGPLCVFQGGVGDYPTRDLFVLKSMGARMQNQEYWALRPTAAQLERFDALKKRQT